MTLEKIISPEDAKNIYKKLESESLDIMKDHANQQGKLSKELRDWLTNLATISATIISIIIAFRGKEIIQSKFLIIAISVLLIIIIICLFRRMYVINKMSINLFNSHSKIQKWIEGAEGNYREYAMNPSQDNFNKIIQQPPIQEEKIEELKSDIYLFISMYLFVGALILLFLSIF
ncbi:MAG: hypothetical protein ABIJ11_00310 [Elusimicrobiota bacterium]